jgi:DedD protein
VAAAPAVLSKASDGARARALLDGGASTVVPTTGKSSTPAVVQSDASSAKTTSSDASATQSRFVVQVGAFADATRAREVRLKVEHVGLKTYTHVAETKEGRRIRVRVGPYSSRDEAEKAAAKIKKLDLPAALLTL